MAVQDPANTNSSAPAVLAKLPSVLASSIVLEEVVGVVDTLITSVVSPGVQEPTLIVDATSVPIPVDEDESYFDAPVAPVAKSPTLWAKSVLVLGPFLDLRPFLYLDLHLVCRHSCSLFLL